MGLAFAGVAAAVLGTGAISPGGPADATLLSLAILQAGVRAPQGTVGAAYSVTSGLTRLGAVQVTATMAVTAAGLVGLAASGATGYLAGSGAASALASLAMCWNAYRRMRRRYGPPTRRSPAPVGMVRFTWRSSLASSLATGTEQLPLTVLGAVAGADVLGLFRVALSPARLVATLFSPVAAILFPTLSTAAAEGAHREVSILARTWTRRLTPVALVAAAGMAAALPLLVPLMFGDAYEDAVPAAVLLAFAALLRGAVVWSKVMPLAIGRPEVRIVVLTAEGALLVVSTWILADEGATAVALAHLGVALVSMLTWIRILRDVERLAAHDGAIGQNAPRHDY
jgi:O-antigen/teichoic acid export membrane protein